MVVTNPDLPYELIRGSRILPVNESLSESMSVIRKLSALIVAGLLLGGALHIGDGLQHQAG